MKLLDAVMAIPFIIVLGVAGAMLYEQVNRYGFQMLIPIVLLLWSVVSYVYFMERE